METAKLKKFAQYARRELLSQVSAKLTLVLAEGSSAMRESPKAVEELRNQIKAHSKEYVTEQVAYVWFNRFCALRFMDVNRYTLLGTVSPVEGQFQPEILAEAKMGHIDQELVPEKTRQQIFALLRGSQSSADPQAEAYRLLVVAVCNFYHHSMPFLFERISDYTELLMPEDLLSGNSILTYTRESMTPDVCQDVEIIGWLYQFYISERKDEVFEGLKKSKTISPEDIPAATQLFTPHWIVRYVVDNTLGRLWMLNHPNSPLAHKMNFYITPDESETEFVRIKSPEELKVCDPACGSGHMLLYAFDLLYEIYEEEGYDLSEIPKTILTRNLFGIEIDERARELASFALVMKATSRHKQFLLNPVQPSVCVLENVRFDRDELQRYTDFIGRDLFTVNLLSSLHQFEESDNFGSLIRPDITDVGAMLELLEAKNVSGQLLLGLTHSKVLKLLKQADYLSPKYHVVIANPPYMGGKGFNPRLRAYLQSNYPDVKSDLFSAFIVRIMHLTITGGFIGMMTPFTWMFISSFEKLRSKILREYTLTNLVRPEYHAFFESAYVPICAFTLFTRPLRSFYGSFIDLQNFYGADVQPVKTLEAINNHSCSWFYRASSEMFEAIPGSPIAYWVPEQLRDVFTKAKPLDDYFDVKAGISTGRNEEFILEWHEVDYQYIRREDTEDYRYTPHNKGGGFRKWSGNWETVLKYSPRHLAMMQQNPGFRHDGQEFYFKPMIGWSKITSGKSSFRFYPQGFTFDSAGLAMFSKNGEKPLVATGFLNSNIASFLLAVLNPTLNLTPQVLKKLPLLLPSEASDDLYTELINTAQADWDSYETAWDFKSLPLLASEFRKATLADTYSALRAHWNDMTQNVRRLEGLSNRIFIDAFGLAGHVSSEVPLEEITLSCNPSYRYDHEKTEDELEALLLTDTLKEFISFAVGCMFGRYSLDKPGLIIANQGENLADFLKQYPQNSFLPDKDNVIPILDSDWFTDDISERFRTFLRATFGDLHYEENIGFIERSINKDIRKYFLKDFYNDHLKRYKKRPIYWLFSSPKGSFNALIYMHRYRPDTVGVVLNDYLREFRAKLASRVQHLRTIDASVSASQAEKTKALKEIEKLNKGIKELEDYEREVLYPLASQRVTIDLDDGVKINYLKLGEALKKIPGLDANED